MNWHDWSRSDWNEGLVRFVFDVRRQHPGPLRTIDVTPAYLASVVGEDREYGKNVRHRFLATFHVGAEKARDLFDAAVQLSSGPVTVDSEPPFFAQLYLSCIVASATKETYGEGQFRRRLATILGLDVDLDYLSRYGLPRLWEALSDWSTRAAEAGRPIRPLILPDPGNETIIGYSKRLAFPAYRDQERLARLIVEQDLSSDSPLEHILTAVGSRAHFFGSDFRREFLTFRRAVTSNESEATDTPFWAAFESISWTPTERATNRESRLRLVLTVDFSDPSLELLVTRVGNVASGTGWRVEALPHEVEGCEGRVIGDGDTDHATLLRYLLAGGDFHGALKSGYLLRTIEQGCVPFGRAETYPWVSRPSLPPTGDAWLLLRDDVSSAVIGALYEAVPESGEIDRIRVPEAEEWTLVGPLRCGEATRKLSETAPFNQLDAFATTLAGNTLQVRRTIRLPDGILFLAPRLPVVSCPTADEVVVHVGEESSEQAQHLVPLEEGVWSFPRSVAESVPGRLTIRATRKGRFADARVISAIRTCSLLDKGYRFSVGTYACETDVGQLAPLDDLWNGPIREDVGVDSIKKAADRVEVRLPQLLPKTSQVTTSDPGIKWTSVQRIPGEWWDVLEVCLALTNLRANGFSWQELLSIVSEGLSTGNEAAAMIAAENLIQNRQVLRLVSTKSRGVSFFAHPAFLTVSEDTGEIRVGGVLGRLRRARLIEWAETRNREVEVATLGRFEAIGAIRIAAAHPREVENLAEWLGIGIGSPLGSAVLPEPEEVLTRVTRKVRLGERPTDWALWSPRSRVSADAVTMESRRPEREPASYVLLWDGEPVWGTQSRSWARLIFAVVVQRLPWSLSANGTLLLRQAAPEVFGKRVGCHERGVCGRSWLSWDDPHWAYPFSDAKRAVDWLGSWIGLERSQASPARRRWAEAYAQNYPEQGRAEVFARRYLD